MAKKGKRQRAGGGLVWMKLSSIQQHWYLEMGAIRGHRGNKFLVPRSKEVRDFRPSYVKETELNNLSRGTSPGTSWRRY